MDVLERYKKEISEDLVINEFNIKDVQLKLPSRKHFWAARLIDTKIQLSALTKKKKIVKVSVARRIIAESPVKLTQANAESAAESSEEVEKINALIKECECIVEYLEKVEKIFSTLHWEIKNIIELNKLEQL